MAPPGGAPPGPQMPPGGPQGPPPPAPPPGVMPPPRPPTPFAGLTDLPSELTGGWQLVDGIIRQLKLAIRHPDFLKLSKVVAVLYRNLESLNKLLSHYTQKGDAGGAPTSVADETSERGGDSDSHFVSTDVEAQPASET